MSKNRTQCPWPGLDPEMSAITIRLLHLAQLAPQVFFKWCLPFAKHLHLIVLISFISSLVEWTYTVVPSRREKGSFTLHTKMSQKIALLPMFPGIPIEMVCWYTWVFWELLLNLCHLISIMRKILWSKFKDITEKYSSAVFISVVMHSLNMESQQQTKKLQTSCAYSMINSTV